MLGVGAVVAGLASAVSAWPAVQTGLGVHLCDGRPEPLPGGAWRCRSGGGVYEGLLVDVSRGPDAPRPYPGGPWRGTPWDAGRRGGSGYDELDPWLGPRGGSDR